MRSRQKGSTTLHQTLFKTAWYIERQHLESTLFTYLIVLTISAATIILSLLLSLIYKEAISLLLIPAATLTAWYKNGKTGILTTVVITGIFYILLVFRYPYLIQVSTALQLAITFFSSLLICLALDKTRRIDVAKRYKEREKTFAKMLFDAGATNQSLTHELKMRDEFLSIVSHELKTPLTSMLLQLQTALHNINNVSLANFSVQNLMVMLQSAQEQSERLSKMINDLLNISLITTGRFDLEKEPVNLTRLTGDILQELKGKAKKDGYTINYSPHKSVSGSWDRLRIEQVVTNLLTNAIKYGDKKPIDIKIDSSKGQAILTITDHGIGIPPDQRRHIFNRFQRAVSARRYQGFGVGLYITKQIIDAHSGTIDVKSGKRQGTSFTVRLPLDEPHASVENKVFAK